MKEVREGISGRDSSIFKGPEAGRPDFPGTERILQ